jgi:branched-chain amino acid aminotransferase
MPSMVDARNNGFDDVLWLIDDYVKEMTVLNVFMLWKSRFGTIELVTPPNDGCIYNGAIRQSIIELADEIYNEKGVKVVERQISIHEIISAYNEDRMLEFFGGATSSSIQSISRIGYKDQLVDLSEREPAFTKYLSAKLNGIMTGADNH